MVFGSDRFTMKYRMSGRTARTRDEVLASGSRASNKISEGMSGVAGQVVRGHQRLQERTNARNTANMKPYTPPTSSGSLYSDPSVLGKIEQQKDLLLWVEVRVVYSVLVVYLVI